MTLYHYTCSDHGEPGIRSFGAVVPNARGALVDGEPLLWLTDLDVADQFMLGLTSFSLPCDRTEVRFVVDGTDAVWWPTYARKLARHVRENLELAPGVRPAHWWVSTVPAPVVTP